MTCCLSSWRLVTASGRPPIASCCKAQSKQMIAEIKLPSYTNVSMDWTTSGSYDRVHFQSYLECLDDWSEARAAEKDYRLLFVDVAAAHLGKDTEEC